MSRKDLMFDVSTPLSIDEMTDVSIQMYERCRDLYPDNTTRGYDAAVESTQLTLRSDFGVDLNDPTTKDICVRMYAALVSLTAGAADDGLDQWLGFTMMGSALGAPTD